ncbi:hypothetical protein LTS15_002558 [Exophiala xenobiotica]|nr:hypothetical protein LTS15_002558 [Exophiala xenobiotica]
MALERVKDDTYSESERSTWTYLVYQYDILMQRNQEIFLIPSESLSELRQQLQVTLRKSFLAKYGDYEEKREHTLGQLTHAAVRMACRTMGIHEDRALWMIEHYAERNEHFHANIEDTLALGDSAGVAQTLYADLKDINNVFLTSGVEENNEIKKTFRYVIEKHIEKLFTFGEKFKDEPRAWQLTEKGLEIMYRKTQEKQLNKAFIDVADKERHSKENQLQLAKSAIRDIQLGERRFYELSLEEISALQVSDSHWRASDEAP